MITAGDDGVVRVFGVASRAIVSTTEAHGSRVWIAVPSPDGTLVATASDDGRAIVADLATGRTLAVFAPRAGAISWVDFSTDGTRLLTSHERGAAYVWDVSIDGPDRERVRARVTQSVPLRIQGGNLVPTNN